MPPSLTLVAVIGVLAQVAWLTLLAAPIGWLLMGLVQFLLD